MAPAMKFFHEGAFSIKHHPSDLESPQALERLVKIVVTLHEQA